MTAIRNNTDRNKLLDGEAESGGLAEYSSYWTWEVSENGAYTYASPQIKEILGYEPHDVIGRTPFELMPPDEANRIAEIFRDSALKKKPIVALENINLHKNGRPVVLETSGHPIFDQTGEFIGYQGIDRDITRLKMYEKTIEESEKKFRFLIEMLPLPIAVSEIETGRLVDVNDKLCEMSKLSKKELVGKTATEVGFYSAGARNKFVSALSESGEIREFEMDFKVKDGSTLHTLMFARIIDYRNKRYILTAIYDRTDRERLETQQRKIRELESIATLSGGIAHEFNNALTVALGNVEMLQTHCRRANESIRNLADLTKHLNAYGRGGKYNAESLNISDQVEKIFQNVQPGMHPDVIIDMDLSDSISNINADAAQLQLVMGAVLKNALEAVEGYGRIRIKTMEKEVNEEFAAVHQGITPGRYVTIAVEDDGIGMDEDSRKKIFNPFFTTKFQGRGLGMSAVYGIVKNHDGYVFVDSELGNGTTVQIYLPPE